MGFLSVDVPRTTFERLPNASPAQLEHKFGAILVSCGNNAITKLKDRSRKRHPTPAHHYPHLPRNFFAAPYGSLDRMLCCAIPRAALKPRRGGLFIGCNASIPCSFCFSAARHLPTEASPECQRPSVSVHAHVHGAAPPKNKKKVLGSRGALNRPPLRAFGSRGP